MRHERRPLAHNLAEVIDDLYRQHAAPRHHERLIALVQKQIERAMWLAVRADRQGKHLMEAAE